MREEGDSGSTSINAWFQSGGIDKEGYVKGLKLTSAATRHDQGGIAQASDQNELG